LHKAWQAVVDRHPSLRTLFVSSTRGDGAFNQVVLKRHSAAVSSLQADCGEDDVVAMLKSQPKSISDPSQPPHHLTICSTPEGNFFCMLDISHALVDGISIALVLRDLAVAYEGRLPEGLAPKYGEYIQYIRQQPDDAASNYWQAFLADVQPCLLPAMPSRNDSGAHQSLKVDFGDITKLQGYCDRHGVTAANIIQAAWGLVLQRYTGSDNVCFGYLVSGRDVPISNAEETIGVFINMLVCRADMGMHSTASEVVQKMNADFLEGLPHQHYSLAKIQHAGSPNGERLFNTAISMQRREETGGNQALQDVSFQDIEGEDPTEVRLAPPENGQ
jgi:hypothetical protein